MRTTTYTSPIDRYRHGVAILTDKLGPVDAMNGMNRGHERGQSLGFKM